ncbi:MAG: hypothetical protein KC502_05680 [Myxococcales bacterium]|nr:hypothetical protein [Myxococcales bacterium]
MDLPFDALLTTLQNARSVNAGWAACCDTLHKTTPSPAWEELKQLNGRADAEACKLWLDEQLEDASQFLNEVESGPPHGIALWMDPQSMADDEGWCLEVGATSDCDPAGDELDWTDRCPWFGDFHLIHGLTKAEAIWLQEAHADARDVIEYACFMFYGGLVLQHALMQLDLPEPWMAAWGFPEGDRGILARGDGPDINLVAQLV